MEDGFQQSPAVGSAGGDLFLQLVAQGQQFVHFGDDAVPSCYFCPVGTGLPFSVKIETGYHQ